MSIEEMIMEVARKALMKTILDGQWIAPDYAHRFKVPPEFLASIWERVDKDRLRDAMVRRIEAELADRIVNQMAAEIGTDVKQILSVQERREALRALARQHMESIMRPPVTAKG